MRMRQSGAFVFSGLVAAALLSGCAVDSSSQEGSDSITVACGSNEEICNSVLQRFEESTGISTNFVRLSGGEILARLETSKGAANAEFDVWWGGPAESFAAAAERDLLTKYDAPGRAGLDPRWMDEEGYWQSYMVTPNGICVSTTALDRLGVDEPQTWEDLTAPEFRNNVAMAHPTTSGTGFGMLATQYVRFDGDADAAIGYLKRLHPSILQYTKGGTAPIQMVVAGEVAVGQGVATNCEHAATINGLDDLKMIFPSDGIGVEVGAMAIVNGARNMDAAKKFIDWAMTDEAFQAHIDTGFDVFTPSTDGRNAAGDSLADLNILEGFDPVALGAIRVDLANRFADEVASEPVD